MKNIGLVFLGLMIVFSSSVMADQQPIKDMIADGQAIRVVDDSERGRSVLAIGFADQSGNRNQDVEIARNIAFEALAGFVEGRTVVSDSRVYFEMADGESREEFMSSIRTNVEATLRAIETEKVGSAGDRVYVVLRVSPSSIEFSNEIRGAMASNEIIAKGISSLESGLDRARRLALDEALRSAVSQFGGVATAATSSVTDQTELRSQISSRSRGSVSSYRIIDERSQDGYYYVEIAAIVVENDERSEDMQAVIQDSLGRPGYFLDRINDTLLKAELEKLLKDGNFHVVTDRSAARFIIEATTAVEEFPSVGGVTGRTTALTIRVFDTFSSEQLHVFENDPANTLQVSTQEQLRERRSLGFAIDEIADLLKESLATGQADQFENGARVTVSLAGFDRMRLVDMFETMLEEMPQVNGVSIRPIVDKKATFDVFYQGNPAELPTEVLRNAQRHRLFGLRVRSGVDDEIAFTF